MLKRRFIGLIIPYICWSIILSICVVPFHLDIILLMRRIGGFEQSGLWFLAVLFILKSLHYLFWIFEKTLNTRKKIVFEIIIISVLWSVVALLAYFTKYTYFVNTVSYAIPYFTGVLLIKEKKFKEYIQNKYIIVCSMLVYAIGINYFSFRNTGWMTQLLRIFLSSLVIVIVLNMEQYIKANKIERYLSYIGTYSLQIYLLHGFFIDYGDSLEWIDSCLIKGIFHFVLAIVVSMICIIIGRIIRCSEILDSALFGNKAKINTVMNRIK